MDAGRASSDRRPSMSIDREPRNSTTSDRGFAVPKPVTDRNNTVARSVRVYIHTSIQHALRCDSPLPCAASRRPPRRRLPTVRHSLLLQRPAPIATRRICFCCRRASSATSMYAHTHTRPYAHTRRCTVPLTLPVCLCAAMAAAEEAVRDAPHTRAAPAHPLHRDQHADPRGGGSGPHQLCCVLARPRPRSAEEPQRLWCARCACLYSRG